MYTVDQQGFVGFAEHLQIASVKDLRVAVTLETSSHAIFTESYTGGCRGRDAAL
jgi:hypothetical protein